MIDEEHKKLVLPTVVRGIGYGVVIAVLLVNVPKVFGISFTTEVYAKKLIEMNEKEAQESNSRFYLGPLDNNRCELE
jgi:hypothetical protein